MDNFARLFDVEDRTSILDVGGLPGTWDLIKARPQVTLLNIRPQPDALPDYMTEVIGDARDLNFHPGTFDIVFSNSVIEHLSSFEEQKRMASEVRRVGDSYYVQTPNRRFPLEPHYLGVGIQFMPKRWAIHVIRWGSLRGWLERPSVGERRAMIEEIRLLRRDEMQSLFPDAVILEEKFCGMIKSFTAVKRMNMTDRSHID